MENKRFRAVIRGMGILLGTLVLRGAPVAAQQSQPPADAVTGQVLDAESRVPLPGVTVVLEPMAAGAFPSAERDQSPFVRGTRSTVSSASGEYRFAGLSPGDYRLRFSHLGYRPATVEVELRATGSRISVGLSVEPIALDPVSVTAAPPFAAATAAARRIGLQDSVRLAAERLRQARYLPADVRGITHADVTESVSLAETDLFRALQRLPGVDAPDFWGAELWTRGAPWDQTRVYFDGLPLFSPLHAFGVFSGVNADAISAAFLHPGVQPVSLGGGGAGTLELRSRRGGGDGELRGTGELSLASARLAIDRQADDGRSAWMVAGRRSYVDLLVRAVQGISGEEDMALPYDFYDLTFRTDYRIGSRSSLEMSSLMSMDEVTGDIPDVLHRTRAHWLSGGARITLATPVGGIDTRHTLGVSGYGSRIKGAEPDSALEARFSAPSAIPSINDVYHFSLAGEMRPGSAPAAGARWEAGYELVGQSVWYWGPEPAPYAPPEMRDTAYHEEQLFHSAVWATRRWQPAERLTLDAGLRLELGPAPRNTGVLRPAPRLSARYGISPELSVSAAAGRTYQYTQALGAAGVQALPGFAGEYLWLLAGDEVPALRSDIGTVGAEWWIGSIWLAAANGYLRRATGVVTPDPTPGNLLLGERPLFVSGVADARGMELSLRRMVGRWTSSVAYSYATSEMEADGLRFPAPGDRRHSLDATAMLRLGRAWRIGAAYTATSGIPFTRTFEGMQACDQIVEQVNETTWRFRRENCIWAEPPVAEGPNAERTAGYQRLDLLLGWQHAFRSWQVGAFLQFHNALNSPNSGSYTRTVKACMQRCGTDKYGVPFGYAEVDEFRPGVPLLPLLGFRITF
jgi:hypothetical protein